MSMWECGKREFVSMLNNVQKVQASDTTKFNSSNSAGNKNHKSFTHT